MVVSSGSDIVSSSMSRSCWSMRWYRRVGGNTGGCVRHDGDSDMDYSGVDGV